MDLEKEPEGFANDTELESIEIEQNASQNEGSGIVQNLPIKLLSAENNSKENEISSEVDKSVASNKQSDLGLEETLLSDDVESVSLETKSSGKIWDTLLKGIFNDAPAVKSPEAPAKNIPEVPMAVGVFDRLKYIFGL